MASRELSPSTGDPLEGFKVGDHVRLKRADANGWLQPWRKFAETGREAVVFSVKQGRVWCEFRPKRSGAQSWRMDFRPRDLEPT